MPVDASPTMQKFWGLLEYKPQWGLTLKAWFILISGLLLLVVFVILSLYPFLAMYQPIKADALLVEGWMSDDALKAALKEYRRGQYRIMITTGSEIHRGNYLTQYKSYAEIAAASLVAMGGDSEKIMAVAAPKVKLDRTAAMAIAVKEWLIESPVPIQSLNIFSLDAHTRRSWLIYRHILAPEIRVGAIAHQSNYYNPRRWWTSSSGVKSMITEIVGYLYTKLIWLNFKLK